MSMQFGLRRSSKTFQCVMNVIILTKEVSIHPGLLRWHHCVFEISVGTCQTWTPSTTSHIIRRSHAQLKKCLFFTDSIDHVGHIICPGKLWTAMHTSDAICKLKDPPSVTEVWSFLGLCYAFQWFIPSSACTSDWGNKMLRENQSQPFDDLTDEDRTAMVTLQEQLIFPPILSLPCVKCHYNVDSDAEDSQVRAVLLREQLDGPKNPLRYWFRSLAQAESSYSTTQRKCLTVEWALLHLSAYLEGSQFTGGTHHSDLWWILIIADATGTLAQRPLRLLEFELDLVHSPGVKHQPAFGLLILWINGLEDRPMDDDIPVLTIERNLPVSSTKTEDNFVCSECEDDVNKKPATTIALANETTNKLNQRPIQESIGKQWKEDVCKMGSALLDMPDWQYSFNRFDFLICKASIDGALQKVVPKSLQARTIHLLDYLVLSRRPRQRFMYDILRKHFYWTHMARDDYALIKNCAECCRTQENNWAQGHLKPFLGGPLEFVVDFKRKPICQCYDRLVFQDFKGHTCIENYTFECHTEVDGQLDYALQHPQLPFNR